MGVIDHSKEHFTLIMSDADIEALHFPPHQPLALLTQTTLLRRPLFRIPFASGIRIVPKKSALLLLRASQAVHGQILP